MGRRFSPEIRAHAFQRAAKALSWPRFALVLAALMACAPAGAATMGDLLAQKTAPQPGQGKDRLLLQAREMVYDRDKNVVEARGAVQIYYQGRALQADTVRYDRNTNRVYAEGHAKLTDRDGTVAYAEKFDLTDDFRDGFIDSLRTDTADRTHFSAARAERAAGESTVLENGTYTACETCKNDPSKPPLWQIRAKKIIHNNEEQMVYFEEADLELLGIPIAYIPYFSAADPSVTRKSGLLAPTYVANTTLGFGASVPIFWAMAPNYDLTVTPTFYTKQGLFLQTEWRHQLATGAYNIRLSGIFQDDPNAFLQPPFGAGNKHFRGSAESAGQFYINDKWRLGWDITLLSDKWFIQDYRLPTDMLSTNFFREATSTVYLTGQGDRGYFDARGYYFVGLSPYDLQEQQPLVAPVIDWNKAFRLDPATTQGIGGQVDVDFNFSHISRQLASFENAGPQTLDTVNHLYSVCPVYSPGKCILQGVGGEYSRATLNASWKRQFIDPLGEVWTPFAFAHLNGETLDLNQNRTDVFGASSISNASQAAYFGNQASTFNGQAIPGVGLEYRFPFVMANAWATQVFEPIAQVIVRPNSTANAATVNEDAQSLVFDDSNLFEWNKFSGYDRFEGGTRLNYGLQYTMTFNKGGYANLLVGQSYQLAGANSYATADAANVGLSSGLDTRSSDYVARAAFSPSSNFAFIAKGRFDSNSMAMRRLDLIGSAKFGAFEATAQYARYESQPLIGFDIRREGTYTSLKYKIDDHYFATGNVIFDMSRHLYTSTGLVAADTPLFFPAGLGVGLGYTDDCTTFSVNYSSIYQDSVVGLPVRNQSLMVQLQLRTLGDAKVSTTLGELKTQDGLNSAVP